ncbi:PaaI family thioesterase [Oricola indica]|uniref:PaaI family thioesterase n=1 Tax=Oricola indica TaxID=2872591 RepID=UPI003CCB7FC3
MSVSNDEIMPGVAAIGGFGPIPIAAYHEMTGLEILRAIISGDLPAPPISKVLTFALTEADEGRVVFRGVPKTDYLNPGGTVHGGWTATIMDSALACVVQSVLKKGEALATTEFKLNLLRPVLPDMGEVSCEANIVSRGRTIGVSEARLTDSRGRLLAFGTETCSIFPARAKS